MNLTSRSLALLPGALAVIVGLAPSPASAQQAPPTSYSSVVMQEDFATIMQRMSAAKPQVMQRQKELLEARYDLSNRPAAGVTMSGGKAVQEGVRVKLPSGTSWVV